MEKVAAVECLSYDEADVDQAVTEALSRIEFRIPEKTTVLVKPNIMTQNRPEQHTGTHPAVVAALCRILKAYGCRVIIGESISFYQKGLTRKAFVTSGIDKVAEKFEAELIAFEEEPLVRISENLQGLEEFYVPRILLDVEQVINVCKLKTHGSLRLSGAIKNIFGCLPGGYKQKIHCLTENEFELANVFIDLHQLIRPSLSLMDAVVSLDGGPTAIGRPVKTARIFAATNAAALDVVAARMIGYQPDKLPILIQAKNRGMIENFDAVTVLGSVTQVVFKKLVTADIFREFNKNSIFVRDTCVDLDISPSRCISCKACVCACPVGAIQEKKGSFSLDTVFCLSCYHCLFVCPAKAIRIKSSGLNKLIRGVRWLAGI